MSQHLAVPEPSSKLPTGIPFIIGNEVAERFSFYGMKGILVIFMSQYLVNSAGQPDALSSERATAIYHLFGAAAYFFPIIGALLSDIVWGKYKTIIVLSLGYCIGHACIAIGDVGFGRAIMEPRMWLYVGLGFIAVGAGGIKPCVSAHVGDQFGRKNQHLVSSVFSWFYFAINVGAMTSTMLTPWLLANKGPVYAFGLPGILMALATFVFWLGRDRFVHVPPSGWREFRAETFSPAGLRALRHLAPIFLIFIPMFWALFDQTGSTWVLQTLSMDRNIFGWEILPSQIQAANPLLILILIPAFSYVIYPAIHRVFALTPLRKISIGLFVTVVAFSVSAGIQMAIDGGGTPHVGWQLLAYVLLTSAEVMVSITSLEFAYTQSPKKMKSFIMGIYFLGISLGNFFTSGVNFFIANEDGTSKLEGASYYWFFTGLMLFAAVIFVFVAKRYRGERFVQGE